MAAQVVISVKKKSKSKTFVMVLEGPPQCQGGVDMQGLEKVEKSAGRERKRFWREAGIYPMLIGSSGDADNEYEFGDLVLTELDEFNNSADSSKSFVFQCAVF